MDKDKYRRLFIDEAREGLRAIGNDLVVLEKEPAARERFDAVFRHAHSLKGMGAAMGFARFAHLAHRLEDLADVGRQGRTLPDGAFDLLLAGFDALEASVGLVESGDPDPDPGTVLARVDALLATMSEGPHGVPRTTTAPQPIRGVGDGGIASVPSGSGLVATSSAGGVLTVVVRIAPDASAPQVRAFVVHKALSALVGYRETEPGADQLKQRELPDRTMFVRFDAASADVEAILRIARNAQGVASADVQTSTLRATPSPAMTSSASMSHLEPGTASSPRTPSPSTSFAPGPPPAGLPFVDAAAPSTAAPTSITSPSSSPHAPVAAAAGPASSSDAAHEDRTIRVRTRVIDELIDSVGENLLARSRLRALAQRLELPELDEIVDEVERLTRELNDRVIAARMTPLSFMAERLPRVVRDLARQKNRPIDFAMTGMDIELDRALLDELQASVIHLLRNAVDHAHEGIERRESSGKPPAMKLTLRASRDRDQVLLELEDDGGGIDPDRIRARAIQRGLLDDERARGLSDAAAIELICAPGFSTADEVTETSGRGVGMDVVKATVERLGGALRIASRKGRGSTLTLQLPLTVAIIQVLVVEAGAHGDGYVIPVARVEHAIDIDERAVSTSGGRQWLRRDDALVPLFDLATELGHARAAEAPVRGTAILIGRGNDVVAVRVDAIAGQEEVVAKPLQRPLSSVPWLSGGAILADGRAAWILDAHRLCMRPAAR